MRAVGIVVVLLLVAVIGGVAYVYLNAGGYIKQAIETYGPEYLGTGVSVGSVDLDLGTENASAAVRNFQIDNPQGFDGPHAMQVGLASLELDPQQVSETLVVVKRMVMDGADQGNAPRRVAYGARGDVIFGPCVVPKT